MGYFQHNNLGKQQAIRPITIDGKPVITYDFQTKTLALDVDEGNLEILLAALQLPRLGKKFRVSLQPAFSAVYDIQHIITLPQEGTRYFSEKSGNILDFYSVS